MTFIFWHNIISPHQLPYIKAYCAINNDAKAILVVEKEMTKDRKKMGWSVGEIKHIGNLNIIVGPNDAEIKDILKNHVSAQHFFLGIRAFTLSSKAFKYSLNYNIKRNIFVEGPTYYRRPKLLHIIKAFFLEKKYFKHVNKVLAIGTDALEWYPLWGFKSKQIVPFLYCVEKAPLSVGNAINNKGKLKLLFVGRLIKLKGLSQLLSQVFLLKEIIHLDIIGDGEEKEQLEQMVANSNTQHQINFVEGKSNIHVRSLMVNYDCLVLPSLYDGWGAVVNEALMAGLFVLCSDKCGSQELIQQGFNGIIFSHHKKNNLLHSLEGVQNNLDKIRASKKEIKEWSQCIEGESVAGYLVESLIRDERVKPPWKKI